MYSRKVIAARLKKVEKELGFEPTYHSIKQVVTVNGHLADIVDPETKNLKRKLRSDELRWIKNERALCQVDYLYWATRYAFIRDWQNRLVRYEPNVAQKIATDIASELEEQGRALSFQYLKARQLGLSTDTELKVAHRVQFYPHVNAVVASSDPDKSALMAKMMELCWEHQPFFLLPQQTKYKSGELIEYGRQNSAVSIQHGTQFSGIARGTTPTVAHLSEVCDFNNPESLIDASLIRAMHESPWMFLVLESTASGRHNWWQDTWEMSKEGWKTRMSRLCPVFLPWFVGRDIYPTETWLRSRPIPARWIPKSLTEKHAKRAEAYVRSNDLLRKHLGSNWSMPREQMWFWEVERAAYEKKKLLAQFYSEMPADDAEAFQSTNVSVFDVETITRYRENTNPPIAVYAVITDDVPERLRPAARDIDQNKRPIVLNAPLPNGARFHADFLPLKFGGYSGYDWNNKLLVWEYPEQGEVYGIGVDTSDGVGKDRSSMEVVRKGTLERNDGQVAEFASPDINTLDLVPIAFAVGQLYSTRVEQERKQAKMVIECNRNGETTQLELRKMGWTHFHSWVRYDNRRLRPAQSNKLGWFTNVWSRPMMMDLLIKAVRDEWIDVNSPYFVDEMSDLEATEDRQSLKAAYGGYDDRIMAFGIVLFSMHILELNGTQRNMMRLRAQEKNQPVMDPMFSPGAQATELYDDEPIFSHNYVPDEDFGEAQ